MSKKKNIGIFKKLVKIPKSFITKFKNKKEIKKMFKKGKISSLEFKLKNIYFSDTHQFGKKMFYQSYPPLNFRGERPTYTRFKKYNLEKYLNKNINILDIGGNTGFFSLFISKYVNHIDIIEMRKSLVTTGKELQKHEKIKNVTYYNEDFKLFKTNKKYNMIFSFAIHKWIDLEFVDYIKKIHDLLNDDGILLIESQDILQDNLEKKLNSIKNFFKIIEKGETDDHMGLIRSFFYLKKK